MELEQPGAAEPEVELEPGAGGVELEQPEAADPEVELEPVAEEYTHCL